MFFNHLFSLTTLKNRLLNATSFSQVYSGEKISLHKFRKEGAMLSPLIAGLLAACGGSGSVLVGAGNSSDGGTPGDGGPSDFTLYVTDGPIEGAKVYIDRNGSGEIDDGDTPIAGRTDADGKIVVPNQYRGQKILVDLKGAFDLATLQRFDAEEPLSVVLPNSTEGGIVVASPITTVIQLLQDADPDLTTQDAIKKVFGEDTEVTEADIQNPSNYIVPSTKPAGLTEKDPLAIREEISTKALLVQKLLEQEQDDREEEGDTDTALTIINNAGDEGLQPENLDSDTSAEYVASTTESRTRSSGVPAANPDITRGDNTSDRAEEDTAVEIDVEDWGFRDPQGNANSTGATPSSFTYQWQSSTDGTTWADVASGGTSASYSIAGSVADGTQYRVAVSFLNVGDGVTTETQTELYEKAIGASLVLQAGVGNSADNLDASSASVAQQIQGGARDDTITASDYGDWIAGGAGDDAITLGAGADTVVYQYDSGNASGWQGKSGDDTIDGFTRGVDKLVLVDIDPDNPITGSANFETLLDGVDTIFDSSDDEIQIALLNPDSDSDYEGVALTFAGGATLTLNFTTALTTTESLNYISLEDLLDGSVDSFQGIEFTATIDIV